MRSLVHLVNKHFRPLAFAGALGTASAYTGCEFELSKPCTPEVCVGGVADADYSSRGSDADAPDSGVNTDIYDATRPRPHDSGQPQYDAQPHPECRIDLECPEPLKCIEQKCRSDKDTDFDMILDDVDNCKFVPNPQQEDMDRDNIGDDCDTDRENDGKIDCEQGFLFAQNDRSDVDNFNIYFFNEIHRTVRRIIARGGKPEVEPAWSPEGVWFAYSSNQHGNFDIFISLLNGRNSQRLTRGQDNERHPTFSPGGEWVAYSSDRAGRHLIYKVKLDGTETVCLNCTSHDGDEFKEPSYMSDGRLLVSYKSRREGNDFFNIVIMDIDNENPNTPWGEVMYPHNFFRDMHSPTQNPKFSNVFAFSAVTNETNIRQVYMCRHGNDFYCANNAEILSLPQTEAEEPAWSADGNSLYYVTKMPNDQKLIVRRDDIFGERLPVAEGVGNENAYDQINPAPSPHCEQ